MERILKMACATLLVTLLVACRTAAPIPTFSVTETQTELPTSFWYSTVTPSPTQTSTLIPLPSETPSETPMPAISPGCTIFSEEGQLYVLSDFEFADLRSHEREIDHALAVHYPDWAEYEQVVSWSNEPEKLSEIINSASLDNYLNLQINATVALVTLGTDLNWELPAHSDMYAQSREVSLKLNDLAFDWEMRDRESLHAQYPEITNAASYALYAYYDRDINRLKSWCRTYQRLFGGPG